MDLTGLVLIFKQIFLAAVQGVTEIIPISSSGHQMIAGAMLGVPLSYPQALLYHAGTLVAICLIYGQDGLQMARARREYNSSIRKYFAAAFLLTSTVGFVFYSLAEKVSQNLRLAPALMVLNGVFLLGVGLRAVKNRRITELLWWEFLIIGAMQGISALPGISRLGMTLGAALLLGLGWFEAIKLSFLFSIPTIFFSNLFILIFKTSTPAIAGLLPWLSMAIVLIITFATSLWALIFLSPRFGQRMLVRLGVYCIMTGFFFVAFLSPG